jgi:transposase-like protein
VQIITRLERMLTAPDPLRSLRELGALRAELDTFERDQVRRALESGASFAAIARSLGITRQAAHRRYRNLLDSQTPPRLVASPEALAALQRARHEAAREGAATVGAEHVVSAITEPRAGGPRSGRPPGTIEPRLFATLTRIRGTIGVEELLAAARAVLDEDDPDQLTPSRDGSSNPARAA